jgi:hypothetical protein
VAAQAAPAPARRAEDAQALDAVDPEGDGALELPADQLTEDDHGILDPINRDLTAGDHTNGLQLLRFMRYSILMSVEESIALEAAVEDWVHQTGNLFGFVRNLLKQAGKL